MLKKRILPGLFASLLIALSLAGWQKLYSLYSRLEIENLGEVTALDIPEGTRELEGRIIRDESEKVFETRLALPITGTQFCRNNKMAEQNLETWPTPPHSESYQKMLNRPVSCVAHVMTPKALTFILVVESEVYIHYSGN
jgi:hypothetical protein